MKFLKIFDWVNSFSIPEMILIFVFVLYVLLPIQPSVQMAHFFDSALGMATLFFLTLLFFVITHPVVGIIYIFVAYETLRRSSLQIQHVPIIHAPSLSAAHHGTQSSNQALQQMRSTLGHGTQPYSGIDASLSQPNLLKPNQNVILDDRTFLDTTTTNKPFQNGIQASQHQAPLIKEGGVESSNQSDKDSKMRKLNPPAHQSLEEEQINKHGPLSSPAILSLDAPTFKPVASKMPASVFQ